MACGNQNYFVGNGPVYLRRVGDNCGAPNEGWWSVGDANELKISISQDFADHYESLTGVRARSARWLNQTAADFTMSVQNFNATNLAALLQGTASGAVVGGSIVDESNTNVYEGQVFFVAYPGISAVSIDEGITPLVLNTDYELVDGGRDGGIRIITGAPNISGSGPLTLDVSYTHVGVSDVISALQTGVQDYEIRFNGINLNAPNTPVIVTMNRAQVNAAEELSLIGQDITSLSFTGAVLPDSGAEFFTVTLSNTVA